MSKSHLLKLLVVFLIPACASSPASNGMSAGRPAMIDCRRVAPTGSRARTKTVCGPQGRGHSVLSREQYGMNRDRRDPLGTRRSPDDF